MPGPRSAPNGVVLLVERTGDKDNVKTGKTAYKRGLIEHSGKEGEIRRMKMTRVQRERQEEL